MYVSFIRTNITHSSTYLDPTEMTESILSMVRLRTATSVENGLVVSTETSTLDSLRSPSGLITDWFRGTKTKFPSPSSSSSSSSAGLLTSESSMIELSSLTECLGNRRTQRLYLLWAMLSNQPQLGNRRKQECPWWRWARSKIDGDSPPPQKKKKKKKSGNWGLDEIDCHCSHKGQCTS